MSLELTSKVHRWCWDEVHVRTSPGPIYGVADVLAYVLRENDLLTRHLKSLYTAYLE